MTRWPTKPLGEVLSQRLEECRITDGSKETFVTVRLYGKGALPRKIGDGKTPIMKTGYRLRSGDLVYSRIDARNGAFALVPRELNGAVVSKDFPSFAILRDRIHPSFLSRFLSTEQFFAQLQASSFGTTNRQRITEGLLLSYEVPVPPLVEQERIVKLLDEADELRKLRAQADRRTAGLIPSLFHDMFGDMGLKSGRWPKERLGRLATIEATLVNPRLEAYQDLPHIGSDRIERDSGKLLESKSAREDSLISAKFLFDERDVLYSKIRPNLRKVALPIGRGLCSADMYPIRPGPKLLREFLWAYLLTDHFTDCAVNLSARANMPKLNRVQLDSIESPVPPLPLQKEFAARVAEMRAMDTQQAASRRRLDDLFNSMLHRTFQGEL